MTASDRCHIIYMSPQHEMFLHEELVCILDIKCKSVAFYLVSIDANFSKTFSYTKVPLVTIPRQSLEQNHPTLSLPYPGADK